ncbi:10665_t:CDS:1, partial [Dentiscutata erythropus]
SFYSYHLKNNTNKEVDKVWENIIKKYQFILEPLFLACSEKDIPLTLTSSNYSEKAGRSLSSAKQDTLYLNYAIKQYQEAQLYQNWFDPLKINFLQIKEPNNYATISCKVYNLEIPHALLDTGSDGSHISKNITNHFIKYFGLKLDRKKIYRLTGAVGEKQSIGSFFDIPVTIGIENDTLTISDEFLVLPTEKNNNGNNISLFIL